MKRLFKNNKPRWGLCVFLLAVLSLVIVVLYTAWSIWSFDSASHGAMADSAIVLGASVNHGRPSPVYRARIDHAVSLYKGGYVKAIILTGGNSKRNTLSDAEIARIYAVGQGVPSQDALVETQSRTTRENLLFSRRLPGTKGMSKFLIVSDPLHLKRAILIARDLNIECEPSATPTTRYRSWMSKAKFASRETYYYLRYLVFDRWRYGC